MKEQKKKIKQISKKERKKSRCQKENRNKEII